MTEARQNFFTPGEGVVTVRGAAPRRAETAPVRCEPPQSPPPQIQELFFKCTRHHPSHRRLENSGKSRLSDSRWV
jgi:hypothetical protein